MTLEEVDKLNRRIRRLRQAALRYRRKSFEAERQRDAHAEREVVAQKQLLEVESHIAPVWKLVEEQKQKIAEEREACALLAAQLYARFKNDGVALTNAIIARGEAPDAIREHVKEGLADSAAGRVSSLGSFAQYAETPKGLSREWCMAAAEAEQGHDVTAGAPPDAAKDALMDALGNGDEARWPPGTDYRQAAADIIRAADDAKEKALAALLRVAAEYGPADEVPDFIDEAIAALKGKR